MKNIFILFFLQFLFFDLYIHNQFLRANTLLVGDTCDSNPELAQDIILLGEKLGVTVKRGTPKLLSKDGTYEAFQGRLGSIVLTKRKLSPVIFCRLVTHEFIHVLQHLNGNLEGVVPLGWPLYYEQIYKHENLQEAEAYAYQDSPRKVISYLKNISRNYFKY
tara:strand:- start:406 stop:891 length:486 start_codon:yes stop_codon:yes gene_type:complete